MSLFGIRHPEISVLYLLDSGVYRKAHVQGPKWFLPSGSVPRVSTLVFNIQALCPWVTTSLPHTLAHLVCPLASCFSHFRIRDLVASSFLVFCPPRFWPQSPRGLCVPSLEPHRVLSQHTCSLPRQRCSFSYRKDKKKKKSARVMSLEESPAGSH